MTAHDLTDLLTAHPDLCAAVFAVLSTRATVGGISPYEMAGDIKKYTKAEADEETIARILAAADEADLVWHYVDHGWRCYSMRGESCYAVARHPGGALGWLRERCGVATEDAAQARGYRRPLDGFKRAARYDGARRRSIWYRTRPNGIELRAGREGDDDHVRLALGATIDAGTIAALDDLLRSNAWATETTEDANDLDEMDDLVGPFGLRDQNRALDAEQIDRLCRANMRAGKPWGCANVDMPALCSAEEDA